MEVPRRIAAEIGSYLPIVWNCKCPHNPSAKSMMVQSIWTCYPSPLILFLTTSIHVPLPTSIYMHFLTQSSFYFLSTWPNHLNLFLFRFRTPPIVTMHILSLNSTLFIYSLRFIQKTWNICVLCIYVLLYGVSMYLCIFSECLTTIFHAASDTAPIDLAFQSEQCPMDAPLKVKMDAPLKVKMDAPSKVKMDAPLKVKMDAPLKVKMDAPLRVKMDAPLKVNMDAPLKVNMDAPLKVKMDAPLKIKIDIPLKVKMGDNSISNLSHGPQTRPPLPHSSDWLAPLLGEASPHSSEKTVFIQHIFNLHSAYLI